MRYVIITTIIVTLIIYFTPINGDVICCILAHICTSPRAHIGSANPQITCEI